MGNPNSTNISGGSAVMVKASPEYRAMCPKDKEDYLLYLLYAQIKAFRAFDNAIVAISGKPIEDALEDEDAHLLKDIAMVGLLTGEHLTFIEEGYPTPHNVH